MKRHIARRFATSVSSLCLALTAGPVLGQAFADETPEKYPEGEDGGGLRDGQCITGAGCSNFNANFPGGNFSTTSASFVTVSTCIYGGEYAFYNVTSGRTYEWSLCTADGGNSTYDSQLSLWDQGGGTRICYSDDYCAGANAKIQWTATFTGIARVLVSQYNCANNTTCTTLVWRCVDCSVAPANDDCASAIGLTTGVAVNGSNVAATGTDITSCAFNDTLDVWYSWTAPCSESYKLSTCGSAFDTTLAVFSSCGGSELACNDDTGACGGNNSQIDAFSATGGTTYLIRVAGYNGQTGSFTLLVTGNPPSNDSCASPTSIGDGTTSFCTIGATTDGPDETGVCNFFGFTQINADIWYCYTASCTGDVTLDLCGSSYDTKVAVYNGCSCPAGASAIACNDDSCGAQSLLTFSATSGNTYLIRVGGYSGSAGAGTMTISCVVPPPPNDNCTSAIAIGDGAVAFDTAGATIDGPDEPGACNFFSYTQVDADIWYCYTAPCTGRALASLCGSSYDTKVAIYSNCSSCPGSASAIACNDDSCGLQSEVSFDVSAGSTYLVRVGGYQGATGTGTLTMSTDPPGGNDDCAAAIVIGSVPYSNSQNTDCATTDGPVPTCGSNGNGSDVWYQFTPSTTCHYRLDTCGSGYDTVVQVYSGSCGGFSPVACNDDDNAYCGGGNNSRLDVLLSAGTTYLFQIGHYASGGGGSLNFNVSADTSPPSITCPSSTSVQCSGSLPPADFSGGSVSDGHDPNPAVTHDGDGPLTGGSCGGTITRTYRATDACGNSSACNQIITVSDTTPPTINCPSNVTIQCDQSTDPSNTGTATASDNCGGSPSVTYSDSSSGTCPRTITRTWTATDSCGNSSNCTQTITVQDTTAPVISCPSNVTIQCDQSSAPANTGTASASDNCDPSPVVTFSDSSSGTCPTTITRTWTATDNCGNSSNCAQTITVQDTVAPVISCPSNVTIQCDQSSAPANTGTATATDNCTPTGSISITHSDSSSGTCPTVITRTWTATDSCGNSSNCAQTITVQDTVAPMINCPSNVTIQCDQSTAPSNTGMASATDNCDVSPAISFSDSPAGTCPTVITRTWTATDDCGNSSSCAQTITVQDTVAPVINCPTNRTIQCTESTEPANTGTANATDNCDASPAISFSDSAAGTCPTVITRTWTATDDCGNSSSCVQTITVQDTVAPMISCPANATIECDQSSAPANTGTATATDNCDPSPSVNFSDSSAGTCPTVITRTWTAADDCGNSSSCVQTITVRDTTAPMISCPSNMTVECGQSTAPASTGTATATDNCDPAPSVNFSDSTAGLCPQIITRTWTATDSCGNSSNCVQTITVQDTTAPMISCPANAAVECGQSTAPASTGTATASDGCDATPTVNFSDSTAGLCPRVITRTWTATDDCGNSSSCVQTITVQDTTAPMITCPADTTIECGQSTAPANTGAATASDACDAGPSVTFSDVSSGSCPEVITRTWTATDDCGNFASCVQTITVQDTTSPMLSCPADVTIECDESAAPGHTGMATATDNCDPSPSITFSDSVAGGACPQASVITRTWMATDDCGNSSTCAQIITVADTTAPAITCPADTTIECDESSDPSNTGVATATDNCDGSPAVAFSDSSAGACPTTITRTWTATDDCGNSSACVQTINVDDTTPPVITCPMDITIICGESTDPSNTGMAAATDNCDPSPSVTFSDSAPHDCQTTFVRTWTATDACGNTSSCMQNITLQHPCQADQAIMLEIDNPADLCVGTVEMVTVTVSMTCMRTPAAGFEAYLQFDPAALQFVSGTYTAAPFGSPIIDPITASGPNIDLASEIDQPGGQSPTEDAADLAYLVFQAVGDNCNTAVTFRSHTPPTQITDLAGDPILPLDLINTPSITADGSMPALACPSDVTVGCTDSTDPADTGAATATDNCDPAPVVMYGDSVTPGACPQERTITRTWSATDECGNVGACVQTITVDDAAPPMITCPADVTIDCTQSIAPSNTGMATATDNCDPAPAITFSDAPVGTCPTVIARTWTATDACGNSSNCVQTITVRDTTAPVITCPADATIECGDSTAPANTGMASATDNCDVNPAITFSDASAGACPQVITRTWTATDDCGNSASCVQTITIQDTTPPAITCPADVTLECTESTDPSNAGTATATDACDPAPMITFSDGVAAGACPQESVITRTWTATDACGNSSSCVQTITVDDSTPPVITCPANVTIECTDSTDPSDTGSAAATDNCDPAPVVTFSDSVAAGSCPQESVITRTWTATDACGKAGSCVQTITVDDSTPPVITCPADVTVECSDSTDPSNTGSATATDNCDPAPAITFSDSSAGTCPTLISRTWTATDACGNAGSCVQTITVQDTTAPVVTCPADITIECGDSTAPANTGMASAADDCDANPAITFSDASAGACPQIITRTWTATDACGNAGSCVQTITVQDTTPPVITCPADVTIECDQSTAPSNTGMATATDNCDPAPAVAFSDSVAVGACPQERVITRTWTATDACGNTGSCVQTITVQDTTPPVITCPADVTIGCADSTDPSNTGSATATDNCDPAPAVTFSDSLAPGACPQESVITRTWTATDACGNSSSCVQTITVQDTTPPVVSCPADVTVECAGSTDPSNTGDATATDNCDPAPAVTFSDSVAAGSCPQESVISRTWTATDACGNSDSCVQTITVDDATPPMITCPADITVECTESTDPSNTGAATAADNCDPAPSVAFADSFAAGACPQERTIVRTWTATDACGNSGSCVQTITVDDSTPPVIACPPSVSVNADAGGCTATVDPGMATAADNCDPAPAVAGMRADAQPLSAPYPSGTTMITWTATDACGNSSTCTQAVTVSGFNELLVNVQLSPTVEASLTRCITFELYNCGPNALVTVEQTMTFTNGLASGVAVLVPCGSYNCITARDRLHTLRRTDESFTTVGTQYVADFTGDVAAGGDWLVGGNLNDDDFIDILDFGIFAGQFNVNYGRGETTCSTPYPHADVSGDGWVFSADFTFIQINFLAGREMTCCALPGLRGAGSAPIVRISVEELRRRGQARSAAGDLNGDGWLDEADIVALMNGAEPVPGEASPAPGVAKPVASGIPDLLRPQPAEALPGPAEPSAVQRPGDGQRGPSKSPAASTMGNPSDQGAAPEARPSAKTDDAKPEASGGAGSGRTAPSFGTGPSAGQPVAVKPKDGN